MVIEVDSLIVIMEDSQMVTKEDNQVIVEEGSLVVFITSHMVANLLVGITIKEDIEVDIVAKVGNSFEEDTKAGSQLEVDSKVIRVGIEVVRTLTHHTKERRMAKIAHSQELELVQHSSHLEE